MHFGMDSEHDDIRERMMQVFATSGIDRAEMMIEEIGLQNGVYAMPRPSGNYHQRHHSSN